MSHADEAGASGGGGDENGGIPEMIYLQDDESAAASGGGGGGAAPAPDYAGSTMLFDSEPNSEPMVLDDGFDAAALSMTSLLERIKPMQLRDELALRIRHFELRLWPLTQQPFQMVSRFEAVVKTRGWLAWARAFRKLADATVSGKDDTLSAFAAGVEERARSNSNRCTHIVLSLNVNCPRVAVKLLLLPKAEAPIVLGPLEQSTVRVCVNCNASHRLKDSSEYHEIWARYAGDESTAQRAAAIRELAARGSKCTGCGRLTSRGLNGTDSDGRRYSVNAQTGVITVYPSDAASAGGSTTLPQLASPLASPLPPCNRVVRMVSVNTAFGSPVAEQSSVGEQTTDGQQNLGLAYLAAPAVTKFGSLSSLTFHPGGIPSRWTQVHIDQPLMEQPLPLPPLDVGSMEGANAQFRTMLTDARHWLRPGITLSHACSPGQPPMRITGKEYYEQYGPHSYDEGASGSATQRTEEKDHVLDGYQYVKRSEKGHCSASADVVTRHFTL
jgi:hypothetical protein